MASTLIEKLLNTPRWTRMNDLGVDVLHLDKGVYSVGDNIYFLTAMHDQFFKEVDTPLVVSVVWGAGINAIKKCIFRESVEILKDTIPPSEVLFNNQIAYGELIGSGPRKAESASYDKEGRFLYKTVAYQGCSYCFSSRHDEPTERPFAIRWKLK